VYKSKNAWFSEWSNRSVSSDDVQNAIAIYTVAGQPSITDEDGRGVLLLGDTKIRKQPALLLNFGTATAHDIQEASERALAEIQGAQRRRLQYRQGRRIPGLTYQAVKGTGSILSDDRWSPMFNDSFMMAGIHAGHDFHLAEDLFEPQTKDRSFPTPKARWQYFFKNNIDMFWAGFPRVFARECVGLHAANYQPHFNDHGLFFTSTQPNPSFTYPQYLDAIDQSGITNGIERQVVQTIGQFLFGSPSALT